MEAYADKYNSLTEIRRKMNALQMDEAEKARRMDTLQYQINELERAKLKPGEEEELTARRGMLRNAEKFLDAVARRKNCKAAAICCGTPKSLFPPCPARTMPSTAARMAAVS